MILIHCVLLIFTACPGLSGNKKSENPLDISSSDETLTDIYSINEYAQTLTEAIFRSSQIISESLDSGINIAVISINAPDFFEGEYAMEELTFNLVRTQKFRIVDRHNLDVIRAEQLFHYSGEVSDETAVSIGQMIGAAYVITGSISPWESINYLRIRVLDVQTGQIRIMSSISYGGNL